MIVLCVFETRRYSNKTSTKFEREMANDCSSNIHSTLSHGNSFSQQPTGINKCSHPRCLTCCCLREGRTKYIFLKLMKIENHRLHILLLKKSLTYVTECVKSATFNRSKRPSIDSMNALGEHRRSTLNHHQLRTTTPVSPHFN